jgi:uncharacterized membrane protein
LHKGRLEALSDGLFAIVMTLLVLELKIPELPRSAPDAELVHKLREMWPAFFSFVITFLISSAFWLLHHMSFHFIRHTTRVLCWINLIFLMLVSLLPFSTALLGHNIHRQLAQLIYYGNQTLVGFGLLAHWQYAIRTGLLLPDAHPTAVQRLSRRIGILPAAFTGGMVAAMVKTEYASIGFAVGVVLFRAMEKIRERSERTEAA